MKICPNCGKEVEAAAQFCPNCGYKFNRSTSNLSPNNWTRQQHKEFEDQSDETSRQVKAHGGKGKTVTIVILLLIILGAAGGVIYGFGSQLTSNHQDQNNNLAESSSKRHKIIDETNSDGMSTESSNESSESDTDQTSSSATFSSLESSARSSSVTDDRTSNDREKSNSIANNNGQVLNDFFDQLANVANNNADNSSLADYFVNGSANSSINQYQNWSKGQSQNADLSSVTCNVQDLTMDKGAGHSNANFDVKYHFTYNDGENKTQVFRFNAKLERDDDGNYKILSCDPESRPIYSSNS